MTYVYKLVDYMLTAGCVCTYTKWDAHCNRSDMELPWVRHPKRYSGLEVGHGQGVSSLLQQSYDQGQRSVANAVMLSVLTPHAHLKHE